MMRRQWGLVIVLCMIIGGLCGCAGSGGNKDVSVKATNIRDRKQYIEDVKADEDKPMKKLAETDDVLLYEACGPKVRLYVGEDNIIDDSQSLNEKGKDIVSKEKLAGYTLEEAVDYLTERAVIRGYLSDINKSVSLTVETFDSSDQASLEEAYAIVSAAGKVVTDRMAIHGIASDVTLTPEQGGNES